MMDDNSMVECIVDRIRHARFRAAEAEWDAIRSGDDARYLTETDYRSVIEAWMDTGEVRRARIVFDSCPYTSDETRLLEWEILDAEESMLLGESVYPSGLPMSERWKVPSFIPDREKVNRWLVGRITNADDPSRPSVVWTRGTDVKSARVFCYQFEDDKFKKEIEVVPPMKIAENEFFIITQCWSSFRMYPIVCDEAPWNTGRREAARRARMGDLKKWAEGKLP